MKVITTVHYNRPEYTKRCLEYLSKCRLVETYFLLACVEPENDEVIELVRSADFCEKKVVINKERLGVNTNTMQALIEGFDLSDAVIHVEDDILFHEETLEYFEHCFDAYEDDDSILTVGAEHNFFENMNQIYSKYLYEIRKREWFVPWGWGTWKNRFKKMQLNHCFCGFEHEQRPEFRNKLKDSYESWDMRIGNLVVKNKFQEVYPTLSRIQNIGAEGGVHVPNAAFHAEHHHVKVWAEDLNLTINDKRPWTEEKLI